MTMKLFSSARPASEAPADHGLLIYLVCTEVCNEISGNKLSTNGLLQAQKAAEFVRQHAKNSKNAKISVLLGDNRLGQFETTSKLIADSLGANVIAPFFEADFNKSHCTPKLFQRYLEKGVNRFVVVINSRQLRDLLRRYPGTNDDDGLMDPPYGDVYLMTVNLKKTPSGGFVIDKRFI